MRKIGVVVILLLLLFQLLIILAPPKIKITETAKASLNPSSGWQYYKQIILSNPRKNYQIQVHLVVGSGTDNASNNTIYIPLGYCKNFPNDVRFGSTNDPSTAVQLPQWLEYNTTTEAWYWINTTSENYSTIYLFVGNSNATLYSDGNATFIFFDDFNVLNTSTWQECDPNNVATISCENSLLHIAIGSVSSGSTAGVDLSYTVASIEHSLLVGKVKGETLSNSYNQPFNMIAKVDDDNYTKNRYRNTDKYKFYVEQDGTWYEHQISSDSYSTGTWVTLYTKMMGDTHKAGVFYEHYNGDRIGIEVSDSHPLSGQFYISLNQRTYNSGMDGYWDYIFVANYSEPETSIQSTGDWKSTVSNNPPTISNEYPANNSTNIEIKPWCHINVNDPEGDAMTICWYSGKQGDISNIYKLSYAFSDGREDRYGAIDTKRDIILAVGGQDESYNYYDDVEIFNLSDPSTPQVVANLTHTTSKAGVVYDPYNDCFYVYGARISGTTYSDKIHRIDAENYTVTVLTETLPSGIRSSRAVAFSTKQKCAYLLMGTTTSGDYKGQIWRHNPNNHTFLYTGASIDYDYTESGLAVYVPEQDCIYFFGGRPNYWENNFIWRFNCTTETVVNLSSANNVYAPYGAEGWGGYYNTDNRWIYIFAGNRNETSPYYTNQIWKFSPFNYSIVNLTITMEKAQDDFFAVYSPHRHKGYLVSCITSGASDNDQSQQKYIYSVNYSLVFTLRQVNSSVNNGTYYWHFIQADEYNTTYWWKVAVDDSTNNVTKIYKFTTTANNLPVVTNPNPSDGATGVSVSLSQLSVDIADPEGDLMNWTIETSPSIGSASGNNTGNGTITCPVSGLDYGTTYTWYVNVTDGNSWTNKTYTFTTETPDPPSNLKAVSVNTSTISLTWTKSPDTDTTVVVRKEGSYPSSPSDGTVIYNGTAESYVDSDLSPGTAYYYRAWSWTPNSYSSSYTQDMNYTYPDKPTSISSSATGYTISLSWTKGDGADYTVIRYSTSGYPTSPSEGALAYNGTDTSTTVSGLNPNTTYYFSFWAYDSESGFYSQDYSTHASTTLDVPPDPSNLVAETVNDTKISLTWSASMDVNSVLVRKVGSYPTSVSDGTVVFNSTGTSYIDTGLTPSAHYYYRVWTYKPYSGLYSEGYASSDAWTKPQPPQDVDYNLEANGTTANLTITWTKGVGADKTVIRKSTSSYPASPNSGTLVYNGTGETITDQISETSYYRLWSYNETSKLYSDPVNLQWAAIWLNCYDEETGEAIENWSIFISDESGTHVYSATNLTNSHILNISQCPTGDKIAFQFSAQNYSDRIYYLNVNSTTLNTINAYLPPSNKSQIYVITIVGPQGEFTSLPIDNANIIIKRYISSTDAYQIVTSLYTDANGQVNAYLIPNVLYKIIISKEGYRTEIVDFIPTSEIYTKTFRILPETEELTEYVQFRNVITFNATMLSNNTIRIVYVDSNQSTIDVDLYTYELYNSQYTLIDSFTTTDNIFTHYIEGINTSRTYLVKLYFNNTANFDISPPVTITVFPLTGIPEVPNKYDINNLIEPVIGPAPGGSWAPIIAIILPLIILVSFGPYNTTIGIVGSGLSLLFIQAIYARLFINSFNPLLAALGPFVIAIGILYGMTKGRGEEKL